MRFLKQQLFPIFLTGVTFLFLSLFLFFFINLLNFFPTKEKVLLHVFPQDVLVGITIYVKTAIDFVIFIGTLMATNTGWHKRIAIEFGTAFGNALGTLIVLSIWFFFKEVPILLLLMIFLASLVLLQMAQEGLAHNNHLERLPFGRKFLKTITSGLIKINVFFQPLTKRILPEISIANPPSLSFWRLLFFSFTIPFLLGLDDFAGYIPLFSIVNVFGFCVGVFFAHMLLNAALFASPKKTAAVVKNPYVVILGSLAFIIIAAFGFWEVGKVLFSFLQKAFIV